MKSLIILSALFFSFSAFAQRSVKASKAAAGDSAIFLPTTSINLTGSAVRANPGHQIPAKNGNSHTRLNYTYQMPAGSSRAEMNGIFLLISMMVLFTLMNKISKVQK